MKGILSRLVCRLRRSRQSSSLCAMVQELLKVSLAHYPNQISSMGNRCCSQKSFQASTTPH